MSTNGQVLAASVYRGKVYVSTNAGVTWNARDSDRNWRSIAISTNGAVMAAVANGCQVYVSVDSGTNWTARATSELWTSVAMSGDGRKMVASVYGGSLYTSEDMGTNWTSVASPRLWNSVAASTDGLKWVATEIHGSIWMSSNGGTTWSANTAAGIRTWMSVALSADGNRMLAGVFGGKLYRTLDSGVSWVELGGDRSWGALAGSSDLKKAVVAVDGGDHRQGQVGEALDDAGLEVRSGQLFAGGDVAEVVAGGEASAGPAQDDQAHRGVCLDSGDMVVQRLEKLDVEGVQLVGPIEGQGCGPVPVLAQHQIAHNVLPSGWGKTSRTTWGKDKRPRSA
jgi:hypothetical protein